MSYADGDYSALEYRALLAQHDWSYERSDDHGQWLAGKREREVLVKMQQKIDPDKSIWNLYEP